MSRTYLVLAMVLFFMPLLTGIIPSDCALASPTNVYIGEYVNPLDVSTADPQILKDDDGTYYLYGTTPHNSSEGFEVYSSADLVNWRRRGWCYRKTPETWGQDNFWAPEVVKKDGTYYLFYTTFNPKPYVRHICVASSSSPLGPFTDIATPLIPLSGSHSYIDASPYYDKESGRWYLFVMEENTAPADIYVARLAEDMRSLDTPLTECLCVSQDWEHNWIEGPFVIRHSGTYYLMYSGFGYSSPDYAIGYATASSVIGPYTKYEGNPILYKNAAVSGPGHHALVESPDGKELFIAYHTHLTFAGGWQRQLAIDRIGFTPAESGPDILTVFDAPTFQPQPLPSGIKPFPAARSDEFDGPLDNSRWHSFAEHGDKVNVSDGALIITTVDGDFWTDRTDATNTFLQYAPGEDFTVETRVTFTPLANYEQAFLTVFGDQSNYIRFSSVYSDGHKLEWARETGGSFKSEGIAYPFDSSQPVHLRIVKTSSEYKFYMSADGAEWKALASYTIDLGIRLKVGIGAFAPGSRQAHSAAFDYFHVNVTKPFSAGISD